MSNIVPICSVEIVMLHNYIVIVVMIRVVKSDFFP